MAILREVCEQHGILCGSDTVFAYLREFTPPERQLSLFA
jgi:hypothetical protein